MATQENWYEQGNVVDAKDPAQQNWWEKGRLVSQEQPIKKDANLTSSELGLPDQNNNVVSPEAAVQNVTTDVVSQETPSNEITVDNVEVTVKEPNFENLPEYLQYKPFALVRKDVDPGKLDQDLDWLDASSMVYSMMNQGQVLGSNQEIAEYGKDIMGWFNYNLPAMAYMTSYVLNADQKTKEAFLWMMDTYDNTDYSWEGFWRFGKGLVTDPTTWASIGTVGAGFWGKFVTKQAAKATLRAKLLQSLGRSGLTAGVEGGMMMAADDTLRQSIEISAGRMKEFDSGRLLLKTGIGVGGGIILGTGADFAFGGLLNTVQNSKTNKAIDDLINDPKRGYSTELDNEFKQLKLDFIGPPPAARTADGQVLDVPLKDVSKADGPRSLDELAQEGAQVADQLRQMDTDILIDVLKKLEASETQVIVGRSLKPEERDIVQSGIGKYLEEIDGEILKVKEKIKTLDDDVTKSNESIAARAELEKLEDRQIALQKTYEEFGYKLGFGLRALQENDFVRVPTVEQLMKDGNISMDEAKLLYVQLSEKAQSANKVNTIKKQYESQINQAIKDGNLNEAAKLTAQKQRTIDAIESQFAPEKASIMKKATEWAISNVFTVKTLIMNTIPSGTKTLLIPGIKALLNNPLEKATRIEAYASYKAMGLNAKTAFKAAIEAFKYEQSLLTRDTNRILEGGSAFQGKIGGAIRFFPRMLNATDEFMSQINYASFISGRAAGNAAIEAAEKGLQGKEFDAFVRKATEDAMEKAFEGVKGDDLINPIISKGLNRGLEGKELFDWVEKQLAADKGLLAKLGYEKDAGLFRMGKDEEALNFVRDVLYKRNFSGDGTASTLAKSADDAFRNNGWLKLTTGQLFLRTPIRVFEEGIRLTPGVQILAPKFLADLQGKNGVQRQMRARGEALMSQALAGYFFVKYANGEITGGGEYSNYDQVKNRRDTDKPQPYTIKFDDGSTWSYRNFDPLATGFKINANAFDGMKMLDLRRAQGEFVADAAYQKYLDQINVGIMSIARAVKDAGLFEGLNQLEKYGSILADPESSDDAIMRLLRDKFNLVIPNTIRKWAKDNDPYIRDPKSFSQVIESSFVQPVEAVLNIDGRPIKTSFSYDILGNRRQMVPGGVVFDFFATESPEERARGKSKEELLVLSFLDDLSKTTDLTLRPRVKHPEIPSLDLRTVMTADGTKTLYDRYQEIYQSLNPLIGLYAIVSKPTATGTRKNKGDIVDEIRDYLDGEKGVRTAAMEILLGEQKEMIDKSIEESKRSEQDPIKNFKPY